MQNSKLVLAFLLCAGLSFLGGMYFGPKEQTVKIEESKKTDTVKNVDKKETILPDGTKIIETKSTTKKTTDRTLSVENKTVSRPEWRANAIYFPKIGDFQNENAVFGIEKRILSEIYLGVSVSTQKQVGLSISIGF